ncbi:Cna B-type domain-containing protein, partial [Bifidobacterium adolescentis]
VPGYKSLITGTQDTGFTITNTITGKVSVGITKQWIGKAADSVTVDLMNGDQKVDSIELSASNHWQYTFTNLEQYDENGQPISYTISEVNLDGYVSKITGNMNTGFVITNTNTETVDIPVEKSWIGPEGKQAEVNLYKDGIDQIASLVLSESNQWTSTFTDLPVYDSNDGHKIMYAIKETPIDGYQSEITGDAKSGYRIVNTNIETLSVSVKKQWIGPAQAKATFTLYQDGKKTNQTLVLSKQDQWQGSFTDLAKYDHNDGHAYVYTIEETQLPDYDSKVEGNMKDGFTVTNTNTEAVNVPVEKKWIGPAASKVDILLVKDGIETDRKLTLNEWNHWKGAFNDLTKYDSKDGHEIQYAIKEIPIVDYSSDIK